MLKYLLRFRIIKPINVTRAKKREKCRRQWLQFHPKQQHPDDEPLWPYLITAQIDIINYIDKII